MSVPMFLPHQTCSSSRPALSACLVYDGMSSLGMENGVGEERGGRREEGGGRREEEGGEGVVS